MKTALSEKIVNKNAVVAVIGLGYVGLPLAMAFARHGYRVLGIDTDARRVTDLNAGASPILDVASSDVAEFVTLGKFRASADYASLASADVIFICVPTPITAQKSPDLSFIEAASTGIAGFLKPDQLIILQSTTYPGTTEEVVLPLLNRNGLRAGTDFHLAFSPERINPGDQAHTVENTPKVVGGLTAECTRLAALLLSQINPHVCEVSSPRVAEMTKLLENTFRSVNIALVNELALLSERMGIDIWEVIRAARTKPFGYMPFYPGAGVGGHCIGVDPCYLSWKAREYDFHCKFIELAAEVNQTMPYHVVELIARALDDKGLVLPGSKIMLVGVTFKPDVQDTRNAPAERVAQLLLERGARVSYHDPYVPQFCVPSKNGASLPIPSHPLTDSVVAEQACVVITTAHQNCDYRRLVQHASLIVDTTDVLAGFAGTDNKVVRLGATRRGAYAQQVLA